MATVKNVTFQGSKEEIFASAMEIISNAGYAISSTDDAAKTFIYVATKKVMLATYHFEVTVSVSGAVQQQTQSSENAQQPPLPPVQTAMLNVKAATVKTRNSNDDTGFEGELIDFLVTELKKRHQVVQTVRASNANAPGAGGGGGCLVLIGTLGLIAGSSLCCCFMLMNLLFQ